MTTKLALFASAIAAATLCSPAAFAADATASSTETAQVPEVPSLVVTARKREENLQRVPLAVTADTGVQLQQQNVREPDDLSRIVPSLTIVQGASSPTGAIASLRGQSASDVLLTLSQPVGIYEDSVNIPHPVGADLGFFDISRVEVLNGPQGTLYGRNTTGGAINIITVPADYNGVHGFAYAEGGNYNDWKIAGAVNLPVINDELAVRIAYQHWNREGFGFSGITGERLGDSRDDDTLRVSARFDPNPRFSVTAVAEYDDADRTDDLYQTRLFTPPGMFTSTTCAGGTPLASAPGVPASGEFCPLLNGTTAGGAGTAYYEWLTEGSKGGVNPIALVARENATNNLFTNYSAQNTFEHLTEWHGVWDMSYEITDDITLRSITGVHEFTDYRTFDLTALPIEAFIVGLGAGGLTPALGVEDRPLQPDEQSTQVTQEFNLTGTALDRHLHWLLGGFYSNDNGDEDEVASLFQGLTGFDINYHSPSITNESWAIFSQEDYKFNDIFSVTAGGRYTQENLSQTDEAYIHFLPGSGSPLAGLYDCLAGGAGGSPIQTSEAGCNVNEALSSAGWSYLFSLNAQVTPDILLYAKTARGFRGGALQARAPQVAPAKPEIDTDYELGLKAEWFEHRLQTDLDVYDTEYSNKQETQIVDINGAQTTPIVNAASARIQGFEGQIHAAPFEHLELYSTFDYLRGVYTKFPTALTPDDTSVNGSGVPFALPPWTFDVGARYSLPIGPGDLAIQGDYSWHAATPQTVLDIDPVLKRVAPALVNSWYSAVGLLNGRIEYNIPSQGLTLAVFSTNLLDKKYQTFALAFVGSSSDYGYTGQTQEPMMWGVSIRKTFGPGE